MFPVVTAPFLQGFVVTPDPRIELQKTSNKATNKYILDSFFKGFVAKWMYHSYTSHRYVLLDSQWEFFSHEEFVPNNYGYFSHLESIRSSFCFR